MKKLWLLAVLGIVVTITLVGTLSCTASSATASATDLDHGVIHFEVPSHYIDWVEFYVDGEFVVKLEGWTSGMLEEFYDKTVTVGSHSISGSIKDTAGNDATFQDTVYVPAQGLSWMVCVSMLEY